MARPGKENDVTDKPSASRRIAEAVTAWDGVTAGTGSRGELSFRVGGREIGHLHGEVAAHFFFARKLWSELKAARRIVDHPIFPGREGPAARRMANEEDVREVIALMRLNYETLTARQAPRQR
jgi:hypothetical protein